LARARPHACSRHKHTFTCSSLSWSLARYCPVHVYSALHRHRYGFCHPQPPCSSSLCIGQAHLWFAVRTCGVVCGLQKHIRGLGMVAAVHKHIASTLVSCTDTPVVCASHDHVGGSWVTRADLWVVEEMERRERERERERDCSCQRHRQLRASQSSYSHSAQVRQPEAPQRLPL